ncbi:hypothetical protein AOLI_G00317690 [Acnodon oligacanthus]
MMRLCCLLGLLVVGPLFASARCTSDRKEKRISGIIQHLCDLGELRPRSCMKEVENMRMVRPKTPSEMSRPLVMEWSFRLASELFQKSATPANWRAQDLQHLRDLLSQQTQCRAELCGSVGQARHGGPCRPEPLNHRRDERRKAEAAIALLRSRGAASRLRASSRQERLPAYRDQLQRLLAHQFGGMWPASRWITREEI